MGKILGCLFIAIAISSSLQAQNSRYIIRFRDKATNPYSLSNPSAFLSAKSIERRTKYAISVDSTDLPVTPRYIDSVRAAGTVTILNASKWLNSVSILTTDNNALTKINSLPFVLAVQPVAPRPIDTDELRNKFEKEQDLKSAEAAREMDAQEFFSYGSSFNQVHIHHGEFLHDIGLRGQNMVIGILDAGFRNYLTVRSFDSIRANGQILGTWDFVNREASVNEDDAHGMQCFSTMGSNIPDEFVGTAPKAFFYLFRSEDAFSEYPIEEHNWVCAAERVDSVGGDLISSSLGYNTFDPPFTGYNHTYADMNGNNTMITIGADLAAKKGILVVNSAGNEGTDAWHFIGAPADGDSVLAVGAVNSSGTPAAFSSYGPSFDGQVKPDVASVGVNTVIMYPSDFVGTGNGTSFAAPNLAGLTGCLWQGFREFNNIQIMQAMRLSGNRASNPDNRTGFGIPDMRKATMILLKQFASSSATLNNCKAMISWTSKDVRTMRYEIERKRATDPAFVKISERYGTGHPFSVHSYIYEDLLNGFDAQTIQYRIRQVIDTSADGFTADYLDTVSVSLSTICEVSYDPFTLVPNPSRNAVSLRIIQSDPIPDLTIRVFNSIGQLVIEKKENKPLGTVYIPIPVAHLSSGKYFVAIYNGTELVATRELLRIVE